MGRQSKYIGVGAKVTVGAKALDRRWAQSRFPLGAWKKEQLHDIEITRMDPPAHAGEAHTVHFEYAGRPWKLAATQVKVTTKAPVANRVVVTSPPATPAGPSQPAIPHSPADISDQESLDDDDDVDATDRFDFFSSRISLKLIRI